jgi:hypothetical protein
VVNFFEGFSGQAWLHRIILGSFIIFYKNGNSVVFDLNEFFEFKFILIRYHIYIIPTPGYVFSINDTETTEIVRTELYFGAFPEINGTIPWLG